MNTWQHTALRPTTTVLTRENRRAERVRRIAELFGLCRACGEEHLTQSCPVVAEERRRQEAEARNG